MDQLPVSNSKKIGSVPKCHYEEEERKEKMINKNLVHDFYQHWSVSHFLPPPPAQENV